MVPAAEMAARANSRVTGDANVTSRVEVADCGRKGDREGERREKGDNNTPRNVSHCTRGMTSFLEGKEDPETERL